METSEMIEVMQAYERGEQIEYRDKCDYNWYPSQVPSWDWVQFEYRVKKQPTYRPYKNAKEFLKAQEKHGMWLKSIKKECYRLPINVNDKGVLVDIVTAFTGDDNLCLSNAYKTVEPCLITYQTLLETNVWKDGQKCGVKLP